MANTFTKTGLGLLLGGALLAPAFAQSADPCVVTAEIDRSENTPTRFSAGLNSTRRIIDYRTRQVHTVATTSVATSSGTGGGTSISSKTFGELGVDVTAELEKARPAQCKLK